MADKAGKKQVIVTRRSLVTPPSYDYIKEINQILDWYLSLDIGQRLSDSPGILDELRSKYKRLTGANAYLSREVGDLKHIAVATEHFRKRKMASLKLLVRKEERLSLEASADKARVMNGQNEKNAAAAAGNYMEVSALHGSVERVLAAMNGDIKKLEKEMEVAGVTPDNWKNLIDRLEEAETMIGKLEQILLAHHKKIKSHGKT